DLGHFRLLVPIEDLDQLGPLVAAIDEVMKQLRKVTLGRHDLVGIDLGLLVLGHCAPPARTRWNRRLKKTLQPLAYTACSRVARIATWQTAFIRRQLAGWSSTRFPCVRDSIVQYICTTNAGSVS